MSEGDSFIRFREYPEMYDGADPRWAVENTSGEYLGVVRWYGEWGRFCFFPTGPVVLSSGCLEDIQEFLREKTEARHG